MTRELTVVITNPKSIVKLIARIFLVIEEQNVIGNITMKSQKICAKNAGVNGLNRRLTNENR